MAEPSAIEEDTAAVLSAAEWVCGSREQARTWSHSEPIDVFDYETAEQLVSAGRTNDLLRHLRSMEAGPAG